MCASVAAIPQCPTQITSSPSVRKTLVMFILPCMKHAGDDYRSAVRQRALHTPDLVSHTPAMDLYTHYTGINSCSMVVEQRQNILPASPLCQASYPACSSLTTVTLGVIAVWFRCCPLATAGKVSSAEVDR